MTTLQFNGTDMRGLLDILIEAVKLTRNGDRPPSVEVNGVCYRDLLKVALLLDDEDGDLLPHHQAMVDAIFTKHQWGYQRTGVNLAHRVNQIGATQARATWAQKGAAGSIMMGIHTNIAKTFLFKGRGLSDRTIKALVKSGMDAPERLLFMQESEIAKIPDIGKTSIAEIHLYRERFSIEKVAS